MKCPHCGGSLYHDGEQLVCLACARPLYALVVPPEAYKLTGPPLSAQYRTENGLPRSHEKRYKRPQIFSRKK